MRPSPSSLSLQPRPSICLVLWLSLLHVAGMMAIWIADVDPRAKALVVAALGASAVFGWWIAYRGAARYRLVWHPAGHWLVERKGCAAIRCEHWVAPWIDPRIVLLRFRLGRWRRLTMALCADSLPPDVHRRLRARLLSTPSR